MDTFATPGAGRQEQHNSPDITFTTAMQALHEMTWPPMHGVCPAPSRLTVPSDMLVRRLPHRCLSSSDKPCHSSPRRLATVATDTLLPDSATASTCALASARFSAQKTKYADGPLTMAGAPRAHRCRVESTMQPAARKAVLAMRLEAGRFS